MEGSDSLSLVLFSGTDDKLAAAAILAAGAAMMGRRVNVFLQYWALDSFRKDRIHRDHGAVPEAGAEGARLVERSEKKQSWSDVLLQAKDVGELRITACAKSMEVLDITKDDLDPIVDEVGGVAAFMAEATGPITFI
ncbi:MAG: DsrE/DsrF/DrsH-like family protein [Chloroflexota bacterium]|nr:DsrE/DsrF/DrsH-like family protein [Chloroflexota bacterium]